MPIPRKLERALREAARVYPVVTVTGPRQSGKTTLCRAVFGDRPYRSLEAPDVLAWVRDDPKGFLAEHRDGAVLDEVQNAPELLSWLQVEVDERPDPGRFVLTGSQHFGLSAGIAQSLAGRTAVLQLLPPSLEELRAFPSRSEDLVQTLWTGAYPRIHDRGVPPARWLSDYVATYVQRDVRQVTNVTDLAAFMTFVRLAAGRTGAELNFSALGADAGVSHNTARSWLSVLETSFLCHRLPPWHRNTRKQLVKTPKLHFFDSGLACWLLGIVEPEQLRHHPLRGAIFESWVVAEAYKALVHAGLEPRLFHWRETRGVEVDLLVDRPAGPLLVEAKSGATVANDALKALAEAMKELGGGRAMVVHGGDDTGVRLSVELRPWSAIDDAVWLP
jgi:predicted AAA+ superfamily ATPase